MSTVQEIERSVSGLPPEDLHLKGTDYESIVYLRRL